MELIVYFIQVTGYTGLFTMIYRFMLSGNTFHSFNRIFIWCAILLPLILPFIIWPSLSDQIPGSLIITLPEAVIGQGVEISHPKININNSIYGLYFLVSLFLLIRMVVRHLQFRSLLRRHSFKQVDGYRAYLLSDFGPGSYGRSIFLEEANTSAFILNHEIAHIRRLHYIDIFVLQLVKIICWPNFLLHFISRELKLVHEYQADKTAGGIDPDQYTAQLLARVFTVPDTTIAHHFFHHPIKQRIMMLQKSKQSRQSFGTALIATALMFLCSVTGIAQKSTHTGKKTDKNKIYQRVDQMPVFKGNITDYLMHHLQYPEAAREANVEGRVGIKFVVNKKGKVEQVEIVRSSGNAALDKEATRVIASMPDWKPGKKKGSR